MPMINSESLKYALSLVAPAEQALNEAVQALKAGPADHAAALAAVDKARDGYHSACVKLHGFVIGAVARAELDAQDLVE